MELPSRMMSTLRLLISPCTMPIKGSCRYLFQSIFSTEKLC